MSFMRGLLQGGEGAIRASQLRGRRLFQKAEYDRGMHVRGEGDPMKFGVVVSCVGLICVGTVYNISTFISPFVGKVKDALKN